MARWASGLNVLAGLWLIAAPFVLAFDGIQVALWNHVIAGVAVVAMAAIRAFSPERLEGMSYANAAVGAWMIASPFILAYSDTTVAMNNSIVTGVIILALAAFSAYETVAGKRDEGSRM